ncbi:hypothetical protein LTR78_006956 [Recurvomyces mirabilis]|uniref:HCP-like protein n=1 Tax=Recurvomyces mirabilis TaxID=574656 RepID=A0AAE1BZ43_9PEZI|nr:hypothetical protein LTR78_006956 [Recurvomyces mirabilis]KAK5153340.1 hypothetical protein LTS14_007509 [Recurvomyces mirabilis]
MAYDANSAYQPPQRGYYGQQAQGRQEAPAYARQQQQQHQLQYSGYDQASYGQDYQQSYEQQPQQYHRPDARQPQQYEQRSRGYEQRSEQQGYGQDPRQGHQQQLHGQDSRQQQYGGSNGYGYDQQAQAQNYSDGYDGGHRKPRPVSGEKLRRQQQEAQAQAQHQYAEQQPQYDQGYDSRYQQQQSQPEPQRHIPAQQHRQPQPQPHQQQQQQPQFAEQPEQYERNYDPRYQQRPGRATPQDNGQYQSQRPRPPPPDQQYEQKAQAQHTGNRAQPTAQRQPVYQPSTPIQTGIQGQPHDQRNGQTLPVEQTRRPAPVTANTTRSQPTPPPAPSADQKKRTMDEWKAAEKAALHKAMAPKETLAQDNAFPTFPAKKKEHLKPGDRSNNESAMSMRSSGEQPRLSTDSKDRESVPPMPQKPPMSRDNSYQQERPQQQGRLAPQGRPSMDHKPFSFEPLGKRDEQQPQQSRESAGSARHVPTQQAQYTGHHEERQQQRPPHVAAPRQDMRSPPQAQPYSQPPPVQEQQRRPQYDERQQSSYSDGRSVKEASRPMPPTINTTQAMRPQTVEYAEQQPMSPALVPPRPSTGQGNRPQLRNVQAATSPQSQLSYSQTPTGYNAPGAQAAQLAVHEPPQSKRETLSDFYADYHDQPQPPLPQPQLPSQRRDSEIEQEMPDFDGAAPSQRSMADKRKTLDKHLAEAPRAAAPPLIPRVSDQSVQSLPNMHFQQPHQQPQQQRDVYREMVNRKQPPADRRGPQANYGSPHPQQQQHSQDQPHSPAGQYPPQQFPGQTPKPPYAQEPPVRRSMDDGRQTDPRQMPYRQGPSPGQRFPGQGQPPRGPYPPQQRPGMEQRGGSGQTVQTVWSDPGQQRVPSAPPLQQGLRQPPGPFGAMQPIGHPLSQQRSAPEDGQSRHSNPDALPQHPVPFRPGLTQESQVSQPAKPHPVRNYDTASIASHGRQASLAEPTQPVTPHELEQLRNVVNNNPGDAKASFRLGKKLVEASKSLASEGGRADPKTTTRNYEKYVLEAHKRIKKAATAGYPEAQFYLADAHGQGSLGLEADTKEAFNLYQAAAKAGHAGAAYRTAVCCEMGPEEGGGTRRDYAKAVQWYRRAAALGDIAAMYKLGIILLKGLLGQQRNIGDSVNWLKRAAEKADKHNPHALHELGMLYESTNTHPEIRAKIIADDNYARELFTQAAQLGYKTSQFRLGQAYEYGHLNLPIDNRASISWYSKAAAQGEHQAELALSGWYLTGSEGILKNSDTEAYLWARKAAQSEPPLAKAMFAMGYFSEMGIGCPISMEEARRWYGRAASYKFPKALERLEELKKNAKSRPTPGNGKLKRDQKRDEAECAVM